MMKTLGLHRLCRQATGILSCQEIHTNSGLLARRASKPPRNINYEPGIRHRDSLLEGNKHFPKLPEDYEVEGDYEDDLDLMNVDKAYDEDIREQQRSRRKLGFLVAKKKFFSPRAQPQTLTYQDRECIRYLHKKDPVQWSVKSLSESFPATTEVISKVLKTKRKFTPERAKRLDSKVQENWRLLEEGKLDADPHVLEHLKKFINRREVLLEQIKNDDLYLPEIKKEPVWNNGEFNSVLTYYEKQVKKLQEASNDQHGIKLLADKSSDKERKSALDYVHQKIEKIATKKQLEEKDSFMVGEMVNAYSKEKTLEEVENQILQKAEVRKPLGVFEKAILETKLGVPNHKNFEKLPESSLSSSRRFQDRVTQKLADKQDSYPSIRQKKRLENQAGWEDFRGTDRGERAALQRISNDDEDDEDLIKTDDRTKIVTEKDIGKLLNKICDAPTKKEELKKEKKVKSENLDPESLALENAFYNREVEEIKNTSFWNNNRSSKEKALAECQKPQNDGLAHNSHITNPASKPVFSTDMYPERINIPKNQRGSGLTFRIKDCYYDDDGKFLYRVPGMIKS